MSSSTWGLVDQSISIILTLHRKFIDKISSICSTFVESIPSNNPPSLLEQNSRAPFKRRPSSKFERSLLKEAPRVSFPAGQLPDNEASNPASVTPLPGRCPTRGSSEIQISHARHFSRSLSLSLSLSPLNGLDLEDDARTTVEPDFSTGASFISRFHPLIWLIVEDLDLPPAPALITFRSAYAYMAAALKAEREWEPTAICYAAACLEKVYTLDRLLSPLDEDADINGGLIRRFLVKESWRFDTCSSQRSRFYFVLYIPVSVVLLRRDM